MFESKRNNAVVSKVLDFEQIKAVLYEDNVLHYYIKENCFIAMTDVMEVMDAVMEWGDKNKYLHVFESGLNSSIDTDVREWMSSDKQNKNTIADAILVKNMAQRIVGNFYLQFNRPVKPTKLFTSFEEAIKWLTQKGTEDSSKALSDSSASKA